MTSTGISASFVGLGSIVYREEAGSTVNGQTDPGCTITYVYDPGGSVGGVGGDKAVPDNPPIAAGRIWGHIKCPNTTTMSMQGAVCDAEADFIFEQCQQ